MASASADVTDESPDEGCRVTRIDVSKVSRISGSLLLGSLAILVAALAAILGILEARFHAGLTT